MIQFTVTSGQWSLDGTVIGTGYAGAPGHVGVTADEALVGEGPIPRGLWTMDAPVHMPESVGPYAIPLHPMAGTRAFGRSGFFIHGDNAAANQTASRGCPIAPGLSLRELIYRNGPSLDVI